MASWRLNNDMLTWPEKILLGIGLIPAMIQGQKYVERWTNTPGRSGCVNRTFLNGSMFYCHVQVPELHWTDEISATILLTALNRFLQEKNGSKMAFLDGSPQSGCVMVDYISDRGGEVRLNAPLKEILLNPDGTVKGS